MATLRANRRKVLLAVLEVLGALVVGALLYLLARPSNLLVFGWIDAIGLAAPLARMRVALAPVADALPAFVLFSLPNALWAYAFTAAMSHMWSHRWTRTSAIWIAMGPVISVVAELGQGVGVVPGTFDVVDLLLVVVACAAALRRLRAGDSPKAMPSGSSTGERT